MHSNLITFQWRWTILMKGRKGAHEEAKVDGS